MTTDFSIRDAAREDAREIAKLYLIASDGLAEYIWRQIDMPGLSPEEIGAHRYAREDVPFSYQRCMMAERDGRILGMLNGFEMPESDGQIEEDPVLQPYAELEDAGSYYISGIALYPDHRGQGIGSALLKAAHERARNLNLPRASLICFERNQGALRLYQRFGYEEQDRRPLVPHPTLHYTDGDAILMVRSV